MLAFMSPRLFSNIGVSEVWFDLPNITELLLRILSTDTGRNNLIKLEPIA